MKTRDEEWFMDDQEQWFAEQKRDEDELRALREAQYREQVMEEVIIEFKQRYMARLQEEAEQFARAWYRRGFLQGFCAALVGAALFIYFSS